MPKSIFDQILDLPLEFIIVETALIIPNRDMMGEDFIDVKDPSGNFTISRDAFLNSLIINKH